jgi:ERG8-type phosphomevalonate kinase
MEVTAPGKILLLGGYAVLESYPAVSLAIVDKNGHGVDAKAEKSNAHRLVSREFGIDMEMDGSKMVERIRVAQKHEKAAISAYCVSLAYMKEKGLRPKPVAVELDNSPIFGAKDEKSGLGSSAASTVAVISCLLESNGLALDGNRETIHRLAQIAHAFAMEKTGSGFDIATSSYGSIIYEKFATGSFSIDMEKTTEDEFGNELVKAVEREWKGLSIKPFALEGYELAAFNIRGARTSTVSSVRAVKRLSEYCPELYQVLLRAQAGAESAVLEGISRKDDGRIREGMREARAAQRKMSEWVERTGMLRFDPIEPKPLTVLIDKAEEIDGVVAGRCPGSGGFDSVAFLVKKKTGGMIDNIRKSGKSLGLNLEYIDGHVTARGARRTD